MRLRSLIGVVVALTMGIAAFVAGLLASRHVLIDPDRFGDDVRRWIDGGRAAAASPGAMPTILLIAGFATGWTTATLRLHSRLRQRPLLLMDFQRPDISLEDGIRHVMSFGGAGVRTRADATLLIARAAGSGRVTVWQRAPFNTIHRLSRKRAASLLPVAMPADPSARGLSAHVRELSLVRRDVDREWPARAGYEIEYAPAAASRISQ